MKTFAKINLTLDVLGKRPDGYHEISSVMQSLALHDTLSVTRTEGPGIKIKTDNPSLPVDNSNLVYKAAEFILRSYNLASYGVSVEIEKKIPIAAGLAGGSSNCAAALIGLRDLFELDISEDKLYQIGKGFGADVPFCLLSGGTALAEGIGEKLTLLTPHPDMCVALARLPVHVATKEVFSRWTKEEEKKTPEMLKALAAGSIDDIAAALGNGLASTAIAMHPEIAGIMEVFRKYNACGVNMTGSGPTVFAYFHREDDAYIAINAIENIYNCHTFCTKIYNGD